MVLTKDQVRELKQQLFAQIQHLSHDQKAAAQEQINSLSDEALETMLEQQNSSKAPQEIFRNIVEGKIPSKKINENKKAIAVLEIKPISLSHIIIIPKERVQESEKIPKQILSMAKSIGNQIKKVYNAKTIELVPEKKFGEVILNIIPSYDKKVSISSQRYEASEKELEEVYSKLRKVKKEKKEVIKQAPKNLGSIILKRKIP